jgi:4-amino-4-deoxy-L-arabinose transferase-like glycosyltransferase
MKSRLLILIVFLLAVTAIRLWLAASLELLPDEAYHYLWAQHPAISYYSQGPGIAVAILGGTSLLGPTEFGVRFLSPLLGIGTSILVYLLGFKLARERVAFWSVIGVNFLPLFNLQSVFITIDSLSVFFWVAALYTFWLAIERSSRFSIFWPLTGLLIGLGFLCKYENALALLSILIFLLVVRKYRKELVRPNFYLLLLCFAVCLTPTILWNIQHEWLGLEQLSWQEIQNSLVKIRISHLSESFGAQLLLYSPLILVCLAIGFIRSIGRAFQNSKTCLLLTFSWPILVIYVIRELHEAVDPAWTGPGVIILTIVATHFWIQSASRLQLSAGVCILALALSGVQAAALTDTRLLLTFGGALPDEFTAMYSPTGWKTIAETVDKYRAALEKKLGTKVFMIGNDYRTASILSFYLRDKQTEGPGDPPVYIPESQDIQNEFSFWPRYDEFVAADPSAQRDTTFTEEQGVNRFIDRTALYVTNAPDAAPPQSLQSAFTRWELLNVYELEQKDLPNRQIRIFACYQYQTLPL